MFYKLYMILTLGTVFYFIGHSSVYADEPTQRPDSYICRPDMCNTCSFETSKFEILGVSPRVGTCTEAGCAFYHADQKQETEFNTKLKAIHTLYKKCAVLALFEIHRL